MAMAACTLATAAAVADLAKVDGQGGMLGELQVGRIVQEQDDARGGILQTLQHGALVDADEAFVADNVTETPVEAFVAQLQVGKATSRNWSRTGSMVTLQTTS